MWLQPRQVEFAMARCTTHACHGECTAAAVAKSDVTDIEVTGEVIEAELEGIEPRVPTGEERLVKALDFGLETPEKRMRRILHPRPIGGPP